MAESSDEARKYQLISELDRARAGLARDLRGVRQGLDVGSHIKHAILGQKTLWFTGAAVTGWLLARIPGRRKKGKDESQPSQPIFSRLMPQPKQSGKSGWALAMLGLLGTLLKPAVTSFLTHKLAEFATRDHPEPPRRPNRPQRY